MFQGELQKRLDLLNDDLVQVSDSQLHLVEKREQGIADLELNLTNPCILFKDLENRKLDYFKNKKCADYVLYEKKNEKWFLHIFEMKRSVGEKEWKKTKEQFKGAMQNALAIAGFLGIEMNMEDISVYSVYRNDKLKDYANPARLHHQMQHQGCRRIPDDCEDWDDQEIKLDFPGKEKFIHKKIPLNIENGTGIYAVV